MKKVILSLTVIGLTSFTACKDHKESNEVTETTQVAVSEGEVGTEESSAEASTEGIPDFKNEETAVIANKFKEIFDALPEASITKDSAKLIELKAKFDELISKGDSIGKTLDSEDLEKLDQWVNEMREKMDPYDDYPN